VLLVDVTDVLIGGTATGAGNLLSGNETHGLRLVLDVFDTVIQGNLIGTDATGMLAIGNTEHGILVEVNSRDNLIGGTTPAARNIISGNLQSGIQIDGVGSTGNIVAGNFMGTDATGLIAVGNAHNGVIIRDGASGNTIGSTDPSGRNIISGNYVGIRIEGAGTDNNLVLGNFVGTDVTGTTGFTFDGIGIEIASGAMHNRVGGVTSAERNIISAYSHGVTIDAASNNTIQGNYIGTDVTGMQALRNEFHGVRLANAANNMIGGTAAGAGNVISGSTREVLFMEAGSTGNIVQGNLIGTNAAGTAALPTAHGVLIRGAGGNVIGGTDPGARNVISGTMGIGVAMFSPGTEGNVVQGNFIGTDITGTQALGNNEGIAVGFGAGSNLIGGTAVGAGNVVSANATSGINLFQTTSGSVIQGNIIGLDVSGTHPLGNLGNGIQVSQGSSGHQIGGATTAARNIISGNAEDGIRIEGNAPQPAGLVSWYQADGNADDAAGDNPGTLVNGATFASGRAGGQAFSLDGIDDYVSVPDSNDWDFIDGDFTIELWVWFDRTGESMFLAQQSGVGNGGFEFDFQPASVTQGRPVSNLVFARDANQAGIVRPWDPEANRWYHVAVSRAGAAFRLYVDGVQLGSEQVDPGPVANVSGPLRIGSGAGDPLGSGASFHDGLLDEVRIYNRALSAGDVQGIFAAGGRTGNVVQGNFIGTDATGLIAVGNAHSGVIIRDGASGNTIGGTAVTERNIISGNDENGVAMTGAGTSHNFVSGNYIGINVDGTAALGNNGEGVTLDGDATLNTIGGPTAAHGNVISGNAYDGIGLFTKANHNTIQNNLIGTNPTGTAAIPNLGSGIVLNSVDDTLVLDNLISGNVFDGVFVYNTATRNTLMGNRIGTTLDGAAALGNGGDGVGIVDAPNNTIGGTAAVERNLISGNLSSGVMLAGAAATANRILGNWIGVDASGNNPLANAGNGITLTFASHGNTLHGNVISGNAFRGIEFVETGNDNNIVQGNIIGLGADGSTIIPNGDGGILVRGVANLIGGPDAADRNVVSGNQAYGIAIERADNKIQNNYIGTDITGTLARGNNGGPNSSGFGYTALYTSGANTIIQDNVIAATSGPGVWVRYPTTTGTVLNGNQIGTNAAGTAALPNAIGVLLTDGVTGVEVGRAGGGNLISGNAGSGIQLEGASGNLVRGNLIGTNAAGASALGNTTGVLLQSGASNNTIGGLSTGERNVISGNVTDGVLITGVNTDNNKIQGNFIGLGVDGNTVIANGQHGIALTGGMGTLVGAFTANPGTNGGNVISGNTSSGIHVNGSLGELIIGNLIGTDATGTLDRGNLGSGITMANGAPHQIGGDDDDDGSADGVVMARNVISGNNVAGIALSGGPQNVTIQGNYIGTDITGTAALGNGTSASHSGISVASSYNVLIGGTTAGAGNLISGNTGRGITIQQQDLAAQTTTVQGNFIGLNAAGLAALGNSSHGIVVANPLANSVTIGGLTAAARNVISGNAGSGIVITGPTSGAIVLGNYVGTNVSGLAAVGNSQSGVSIESGANNNTIGGEAVGARNVISGNAGSGLVISGSGTTGNLVQGNRIGTNATGTSALGNGGGGMYVSSGATGNVIGTNGDGVNDATEGNLISGNTGRAIFINNLGTNNNIVAGNIIGLNAAGTAAVANAGDGVIISGGAQFNRIGTDGNGIADVEERNVISGNLGSGVEFDGNTTDNNVAAGNYIGLNAAGTAALGNADYGVIFWGGPRNNRVGTDGSNDAFNAAERNVISGNGPHNVGVFTGSSNNIIAGNYIGLNAAGTAALTNTGWGILVNSQARNNRIGTDGNGVADAEERNVIGGHALDGILFENSGTTGNIVAGNYIGTNAAGTQALPNRAGVRIRSSASSNRIGTDGSNDAFNAAERNVISGNNNNPGVVLDGSSVSSNIVAGNIIGLTADGVTRLPNFVGVLVTNGANNNRIGTNGNGVADLAERNIISGNNWQGVEFNGGANGNILAGNYIGVNEAGTAAVSNAQNGVWIGGGANSNRIGTDGNNNAFNESERNVISGNAFSGVVLTGSGTNSNIVAGNYIGTDAAGTAAVANKEYGVLITGAASSNRIGTNGNGVADEAERNVISGNTLSGVLLWGSGTNSNIVAGNHIGTNAAGGAAVPNAQNGVWIANGASSNRVGTNGNGAGDVAERNVISGNTSSGVVVSGSGTNSNIVAGNYIGTDGSGAVGVGNGVHGVVVNGGADDTRIGTDGNNNAFNENERNIISGNKGWTGVLIADSGTDRTVVAGNYIGLDATGTAAIINNGHSITVSNGADDTRIGTNGDGVADAAERNVISGSLGGLLVADVGTDRTVIAGNYIGTNAAGDAAITQVHGIDVRYGPADTRIGTDGSNDAFNANERNVISGNTGIGIIVQTTNWDGLMPAGGATTNRTVIAGNYIGLNAAGTATLANGAAGIYAPNMATNLRIGTDGNGIADAEERNVISGNGGSGVQIEGWTYMNLLTADQFVSGAIPHTTAAAIVAQLDLSDASSSAPGNWSFNNAIPGGGGDYYVIRATGTLQLHQAGTFTFNMGSDNGGRLRINGADVIVYDTGWQPFANRFGTVTLAAGTHTFELVGYEQTSTAGFEVAVAVGSGIMNPVTEANGWRVLGATNPHAQIALQGSVSVTAYYPNPGLLGITIAGNYIGTDPSGTLDFGNSGDGVTLLGGARGVTIGGSTTAQRNLISGNSSNGVVITGVGTSDNVLVGNYIGTNAAGTAALANSNDGVGIYDKASSNTIGGNTAGAGNIISGNGWDGVQIVGSGTTGNVVVGNYLGVNANGTGALPNGAAGVAVFGGASNTRIGTDGDGVADAAERNIISGNSHVGIYLADSGTSGNIVAGNYIGTDVTGTVAVGNSWEGISIGSGATSNRIGSSAGPFATAERNIISGNGLSGVSIGRLFSGPGTNNNIIAGNYIGTDVTGTVALGNGTDGVLITAGASNNTIGGNSSAARNVISGNTFDGIVITGAGTTGNVVAGNYIGTNSAGTAAVPNNQGIVVSAGAAGNIIGGTAPGAGNLIAFNGAGVTIVSGAGNSILGNSSHSNTSLGIDLGGDGVTLNDAGDLDSGPNDLQNFPVLTSVTAVGGDQSRIQGTLHSTPDALFRVELFVNSMPDASGFGEGQTFLGSVDVTTNASGNAVIDFLAAGVIPVGMFVTATATDPTGNTSEFSAARCSLIVTNTADSGIGSLREAILCANLIPGLDIITFAIPGLGAPVIQPLAALPTITDSLIIDATTQPGYSSSNRVTLNGSSAGAAHGLNVTAGDFELRGLSIESFESHGLHVFGSHAAVVIAESKFRFNAGGVFISDVASFHDADGWYSYNVDHGIQLVDIGGDVILERTYLYNNDADGNGLGDGLNATDGTDSDAFAIGGDLLVQGASIAAGNSGTPATQQRGVFVESVSGSVTFEDSLAPDQSVEIRDHVQGGVVIQRGGATATFAGGAYLGNSVFSSEGIRLDDFLGDITFDGVTLDATEVVLAEVGSVVLTNVAASNGSGLSVSQADDVLIMDSTFTQHGSRAIVIADALDVVLSRVEVSLADGAVSVTDARSFSSSDSWYHDFHDLRAVQLVSIVEDVLVDNDRFGDGGSSGLSATGVGGAVQVTSSTFTGFYSRGLEMEDVIGAISLIDVTASDNQGSGAFIDQAGTILLLDSALQDNGEHGFQVANAVSLTLSNLTSRNNAASDRIDSVATVTLNTTASNATTVDLVEINTTVSGMDHFRHTRGSGSESLQDAVTFGGVAMLNVHTFGGGDTVQVAAHATTAINLDGGDPTTNPGGDTLHYLTPNATISPRLPGVDVTAPGVALVYHQNFENWPLSGAVVFSGSGLDDALTLTATSVDSGDFTLTTDGVLVASGTVASVTNLRFDGLGGDDLLVIDNGGLPAGTLFAPVGGVMYDGGDDTSTDGGGQDTLSGGGGEIDFNPDGDGIRLLGGVASQIDYRLENANNDGAILFNGAATPTILFRNLEDSSAIIDTIAAAVRSFLFHGGAETITVADSEADGLTTIDSTAGELVMFTNPASLLTISAGTGDDTVLVNRFGSGYGAALTILGDVGTDTVNLHADVTFAANHALVVVAETVNMRAGADLTTSGSGVISLVADTLEIDATAKLTSASEVVMKPQTAGRSINLGSESTGQLSLTDAELDRLAADTVRIGDASGGAITVSAAISQDVALGYHLALTTGGGVTINNSITMAVNKKLMVTSLSTINGIHLTHANADLTTTGDGAIAITAARNVSLQPGASLNTVDGGIVVDAQGLPAGVYKGLEVIGASVVSSGSGHISLSGQGGISTNPNVPTPNYGVELRAGAVVQSTATGATAGRINIHGTGGIGNGSGWGVFLDDASTLVASVDGAIEIVGQGAHANSPFNYGVLLRNASVRSTGTGAHAAPITLVGTAGDGTNQNYGVLFIGNPSIGTAAKVVSADGAISVTGSGGNASGNGNFGVFLTGVEGISSTGDGTISIHGTGGAGLSPGVSVFNSGVSANRGNVVVDASGGSVFGTSGGEALQLSGSSMTSSMGTISITADTASISGGSINAAQNVVSLLPRTPGRAIELGAGDLVSRLGLTDAELDRITASVVQVGDADSGPITISAEISPEYYETLRLGNTASFAATGGFASDISSATLYERIEVDGRLTIHENATLDIAAIGGFVPTNGDSFLIIENTSTDGTISTFAGKPEGAIVLVGGVPKAIRYAAGDGNDVVLSMPVAFTPVYDFAASSFVVTEGHQANTTNVVVVLRSGDTRFATSVAVVLTGSTATAGADFAAGPITLEFEAGVTSLAVPIQILGERLVEADETLGLAFAPSEAGQPGTTNPVAILTIVNDDASQVFITAGEVAAGEPNQHGLFTIWLTNPSDIETTLTYTVTGTAIPNMDYQALSGSITVAAHTQGAALAVEVLDDNLLESVDTVTVTLNPIQSPRAVVLGESRGATLGIADDDSAVATIVANQPRAAEPDQNAQFTASLTNPSATPTTLSYVVSGDASAGEDFEPLTGTVTIPAHELSAVIDLLTRDDEVPEEIEFVTVALGDVTNGHARIFVATAASALVTIADNDLPGDPGVVPAAGFGRFAPPDPDAAPAGEDAPRNGTAPSNSNEAPRSDDPAAPAVDESSSLASTTTDASEGSALSVYFAAEAEVSDVVDGDGARDGSASPAEVGAANARNENEDAPAAFYQEELYFHIVAPDGSLGARKNLKLELLDADVLFDRFRSLPNNVYRIFYRESGSKIPQLLYELNVLDNKIVPSAVMSDTQAAFELDLNSDVPERASAAAAPEQPLPEAASEDATTAPANVEPGEPMSSTTGQPASPLTKFSLATVAAAQLIAAAPRGSWRQQVAAAMESGLPPLDKGARLLRRWLQACDEP